MSLTQEIPFDGGEWNEGLIGQPVFINPLVPGNDIDQDIAELIFAKLDRLGDIKRDETGKEWTVRLKENLRWQDDEKITSDDLVFTVESIVDPESHSPLSQSFLGVSVSRISELETKFTLPAPYVFFETTLLNLQIIPKHIFGNIPAANLYLSNYRLEPVGSGPYRFSSYSKTRDGFIKEYRLAPNRNYFEKPPYIAKFTFKFFPDERQLFRAYNSGLVDGFILANPADLSELKLRHSVKKIKSSRYFAVFINQSLTPALKDPNERKVLGQSVSRESMVEEIFGGLARPLFGPVEGVESPTLLKEPFLKQALTLNLVFPKLPVLEKVASSLKADWEKIGLDLNLSPQNTSEIRETIKKRDYELILFGNILNNPQDLYSFWHSSNRFHPGLNLSLYANKNADALMEKIRSAADEDKRKADLDKLARIIMDDSPAIFLYSPDYIYITSPKLRGFVESAIVTVNNRFDNVNNWYVKTVRKFK